VDLGLAGKVAVVAASSRGLGRAIAEELAAEGARIVICARNEQSLRAAAAEIRNAHDADVLDVVADVSDSSEAKRVFDAAIDRHGRIDILVNNSGGPPSGRFEELTPEMWDSAVQLLLNSTVGLTRLVLGGMKERRWGRILNVTSIAAKQPIEGLMLSNSVRAAVIGFARTLANEVAPFGVTVNNLLPGYTRTDRVERLARGSADTVAKWVSEIPVGRLGEPREFAALAAFLASERASYITGSSIAVDGGWLRSLL
jgi:3-oxoacyl-[acyl-carrier protein] reductase